MVLRFVLVPRGRSRRSATRPPPQKAPSSPPRRLVRRRAGLAARAPPHVALASGSAPPAGKSAPHTTARARTESPARFRAARGSLAGSTASIVLTAARFDRFALR